MDTQAHTDAGSLLDASGVDKNFGAVAALRGASLSVRPGEVHALNYFVASRYTEALEKFATSPNQKVLMMPVEASALIGSIGGIGEMARAVFGEDAVPGRRPAAAVPSTTGGQDGDR